MTTGTKIIESALKRIGAHSIAAPADPESIESGMNTLNSMLQIWLTNDIKLGTVVLKVPGDELGEPLDATQTIIDNLAIMLSPDFSNGTIVVSPNLTAIARKGYTMIKNNYQEVSVPNKVVSSTLPRGAGNVRGTLANVFNTNGSTIDSSDA